MNPKGYGTDQGSTETNREGSHQGDIHRRMGSACRLSGLALALLAGLAAPAWAASFQGLGDLPGSYFRSTASSMSADGSVVVGTGSSASTTREAFRWTSGGGMVGLEVADLLANPGDNPLVGRTGVTVVEMLENAGKDVAAEGRTLLMGRLRANGAEIVTSTRVKEILPDGVRVVNTVQEMLPDWTMATRDGDEERVIGGIGKIVLAMGLESVDDLSQKIGDSVAEVHVIGDAKQPRKALEAIAEGAEVGRAI